MSSNATYYDLGTYHRPISTNSAEAQTWFNRGLIWTYAFNHEEAAKCFEKAAGEVTSCAMAYWGLAYALGPNYNKPWEFFEGEELLSTVERVRQAAALAYSNADSCTLVEKNLIDALRFRYPQEKEETRELRSEEFSIWNQNYADAMKTVYKEFKNDLDIAAIYADSLMNLTPWALWDLKTGKPAKGAHTLEIKEVLQCAFEQPGGLQHPGLLHLYIHLMEMSPKPEDALPIANRLRDLVPDAGHLQHMPTHLDVLCGDWLSAIKSNEAAMSADAKFEKREGPLNFYTLYRAHNLHFRLYAAMFSGQSDVALETAGLLEKAIPEDLLQVKSPPMADWLEGFHAMRVHALIRFGKWDTITSIQLPQDRSLYSVTTAMIHYAKGIAFSVLGDIDQAKDHRHLFRAAVSRVPTSRTIFNNTCIDILAIANAMLDGEIEYRSGNWDESFRYLRQSVESDDKLPYDEPWGWMQPTRHALGALLLEQRHVAEAMEVYAADLGLNDSLPRAMRHPNNVWALQGYVECLVELDRKAEAKVLMKKLDELKKVADIPVASSCFCRTGKVAAFETRPQRQI